MSSSDKSIVVIRDRKNKKTCVVDRLVRHFKVLGACHKDFYHFVTNSFVIA